MDKDNLIEAAKNIASNKNSAKSKLAESLEFLRIYAGEKSSFFQQLKGVSPSWFESDINEYVNDVLDAYGRFLQSGLSDGVTVERRAQIDVVSDFLEQANRLLDTKGVHPAAACVLIGASLEEFLRNWTEEQKLSLGQSKPSLDSYAKTLREAELITKQDYKDITSWSGLRNHAAHGEWDEVSDKKRISLMLEGVNLFMRKYGR